MIPAFDYSGTWTISLGPWAGWLCLAVPVAIIVLVLAGNSKNRQAAENTSDLKFEEDLKREIDRSKASPSPSTWNAPTLPSSVIASIWTQRFTISPARPPSEIQRYGSMLRRVTWDYRREAPLIVAVAILSLSDAGLIRMAIKPYSKHLNSLQRITVERTEQPLSTSDLPAIEGGLLLACLDLGHRRFRKVEQPSIFTLVGEWFHGTSDHPFQWVVEVAIQNGREVGLYQPVTKKRAWYGRMVEDRPVYALDHLAACEDQAAACVARWQQFAANERDLQQTLLGEVAFALSRRTTARG
jgi:hypothetical protein